MKTHVTPELATLLARDIIGAGGPAPRFRDRWSPAEAAAIEKWARTSPWWARTMASSEGGRYLRMGIDTMQYFRAEHPADAQGEPAGWPRATFIPLEQGADPFAGAPPEAARAYLAYAEASPDYHQAMRDPKHPQHDALTAQTRALRGIAAAAPDAGEPASANRPATRADGARTETDRATAIHAMQRSEAYLDKRHPGHADAVAKMQALYEATTPPGAGVAPRVPAAPPPRPVPARSDPAETPHDVIERLQQDAAYRDARHPEHGARVAEMQGAYQAAYPTAAPGAAPGGAAAAPAGRPAAGSSS